MLNLLMFRARDFPALSLTFAETGKRKTWAPDSAGTFTVFTMCMVRDIIIRVEPTRNVTLVHAPRA